MEENSLMARGLFKLKKAQSQPSNISSQGASATSNLFRNILAKLKENRESSTKGTQVKTAEKPSKKEQSVLLNPPIERQNPEASPTPKRPIRIKSMKPIRTLNVPTKLEHNQLLQKIVQDKRFEQEIKQLTEGFNNEEVRECVLPVKVVMQDTEKVQTMYLTLNLSREMQGQMATKPAGVMLGNQIKVSSSSRNGELDEWDDDTPALMLTLNISDSVRPSNQATKNRPSIETNNTESNESSRVGDLNFTLSENSMQSFDMPVINLQDTNQQVDYSMLDCDITITRRSMVRPRELTQCTMSMQDIDISETRNAN